MGLRTRSGRGPESAEAFIAAYTFVTCGAANGALFLKNRR